MGTNVPQPTFGPNGFIAPADSDILAGVYADWNAAFGGNLNITNPEAPQGQLATSQTAIISFCYQLFLQYINNIDPAYSSGRMQDAIGRIYFLERDPAEPTTVTATCSGLSGTVIPVGALALAVDGNIYSCTEAGVIPAGGSIDLAFECITTGPIECPAGTLTTIYRTIAGWDSITNANDGVIGRDVETRQAFEARRAASVALNAVNTNDAIRANVLNVANVLDAYVTDNPTGSPVTVGGVSIDANSLYCAVSGGASADIADAIWRRKPPGCGMVGATSVTVTDDNSGYSLPYPTYTIKYQVPDALSIIFAVSIADSINVPANALTLIQAALLNAFIGGDGGSPARIGATVFASRFYAAVATLGSWAQIVSLKIGSANGPTVDFTGDISGTTLNVTAVASGTLDIGQTITGAGVAPGTRIVSLGTGSGGTGTYNLSVSQAVASESMQAVLATLDDINVNIDQIPTLDASNIQLTLV